MKKVLWVCLFVLSSLIAQERKDDSALQEMQQAEEQQTQLDEKQNLQEEEQKEASQEEETQEVALAPNYNRNGFVFGILGGASLMDSSFNYYNGIYEIEWLEHSKLGIGPNYGLRIGYDVYFLPQHGLRIYAEYMKSHLLDSTTASGKANLHTFTLNADYKYEITERFGVFGGLNLDYSILDSHKIGTEKGLGVGINLGFTYAMASWSEFELGLRYLGNPFTDKVLPTLGPDAPKEATRQVIDFGDLLAIRIGFNFKI